MFRLKGWSESEPEQGLFHQFGEPGVKLEEYNVHNLSEVFVATESSVSYLEQLVCLPMAGVVAL